MYIASVGKVRFCEIKKLLYTCHPVQRQKGLGIILTMPCLEALEYLLALKAAFPGKFFFRPKRAAKIFFSSQRKNSGDIFCPWSFSATHYFFFSNTIPDLRYAA